VNERFLELTQLGKTYPTADGTAVIVRDVNLRVRDGEFICIIGHSGCGKSTVLSIVMGLTEASEGGVVIAGREVAGPGLDRGVVFQSPALLPWLSARDNVLLAVDQVMSAAPRRARLERAEDYLRLVGLEDSADRYPSELSAGMRQRLGIARAFAIEPKVLLLDEPFSLLDAMTRMELQDELMRLWEEKRTTVVMVTHDVDEALLLADRVVMMTSGPAATIGAEMVVPLARPRRRAEVLADPEYYRARDGLLAFLEGAEAEPQMNTDAHGSPPPKRSHRGGAEITEVNFKQKISAPPRLRGEKRRGGALCSSVFICGLASLLFAIAAGAQTYAPPPAPGAAPPTLPLAVPPLAVQGPYDSTIRLEVFERIRGEFVDWFATPPDGPNPTFRYNFLGNKFQLGVRIIRDPYEVFVQFQDSTLANIPDNGVGVGSIYYANTMRELQNGTILRNAWFGTKRPFEIDGVSLRAGRLLYSDALDVPATAPNLKWIQLNRLSQRLIGPFDYTHVGRSFDGGWLGYDTELLNVTGFGFVPTYGGYEVDANRELDITLGGINLNLKESPTLGPMIGRLFWYYYGDFRDVVFLDNRPLPVRQAEQGEPANIHTVGAHVARLEPLGPGIADGMAYGFGQFGQWQSLTQRSWAYGVELGYRLTNLWAKPWMRGGINSGSGDTNPNDGQHGTFFQMLPTAWLYAQFPFYNMMNNQDVFVQWMLDPHPMVGFRFDWHWLRLNSANDLAYFGGGATKNDFFGYGGTNGNGRINLAQLVHFMLTVRPTAFLTFNGFYAHAWGQGVINQAFTGTPGNYGYLEAIVSF